MLCKMWNKRKESLIMKEETMRINYPIDFSEETPQVQIGEPELSELYKIAFLENDTGVSNEFCLNTTSWD